MVKEMTSLIATTVAEITVDAEVSVSNFLNASSKFVPIICSLEKVRSFNGDVVIERFLHRFDVTEKQALLLFDDLKQWLWLAGLARIERLAKTDGVPDRLIVDTPMLIIDEMWHNFICFTKLYQDFCEEHFGKIIHHLPTTEARKQQILLNLQDDPEYQRRRRRVQYSYVYDKLGADVLSRWYFEYAELFTPEKILRLRKA